MARSKSSRTEQNRLRAYQERQAAHAAQRARRRRDNLLWSVVGGLVVALAIGAQVLFVVVKPYTPSPSASASPGSSTAPGVVPDPAIAEGRIWTGVLDINGLPLTVELDGSLAPQAVASTISLANSGFYDQLSCHRLTTTGIFVLQCGDPNGDGTGGPGYTYGPIENAPADNIYPAGTIAMARQGNNGATMGSQFFIVYQDSEIPADAAGGYTVIGRITSGLPDLMSNVISKGNNPDGRPESPLVPTVIYSFSLK